MCALKQGSVPQESTEKGGGRADSPLDRAQPSCPVSRPPSSQLPASLPEWARGKTAALQPQPCLHFSPRSALGSKVLLPPPPGASGWERAPSSGWSLWLCVHGPSQVAVPLYPESPHRARHGGDVTLGLLCPPDYGAPSSHALSRPTSQTEAGGPLAARQRWHSPVPGGGPLSPLCFPARLQSGHPPQPR